MITTKTQRVTARDYAMLPEGVPCQLIDYELVMSPSPTTFHQHSLGFLYRAFWSFVAVQNLGEVLFAPYDVHLGEGDVYQPDLLVVFSANPGKLKRDGFHGAPDIVVEVLSPSTARYDLQQKKSKYEQSGVKEYWIVEPSDRSIECLTNGSAGFELSSIARGHGVVESQLLEGFRVELDEVFAWEDMEE